MTKIVVKNDRQLSPFRGLPGGVPETPKEPLEKPAGATGSKAVAKVFVLFQCIAPAHIRASGLPKMIDDRGLLDLPVGWNIGKREVLRTILNPRSSVIFWR